MSNSLTRRRPDAAFVVRIIGIVLFAYFSSALCWCRV